MVGLLIDGLVSSHDNSATVIQIDITALGNIHMTTTVHKQHISAATTGLLGGDVRVFRKVPRVSKKPVLSEQTRRTFEFISDPANAHRFTKEAALKAFAHVKV